MLRSFILLGWLNIQTPQLFTEATIAPAIFHFTPVQRTGVTDQRFKYAQQILNDTRSAARQNPTKLNTADFWNITTAFVVLKEPKANIEAAFLKAIHSDGRTICSYLSLMGPGGLDQLIPEVFLPFYAQCAESPPAPKNELKAQLQAMHVKDTRYRRNNPVDWSRQTPLDEQNQRSVDSLFRIYRTYIGRSLAGKELATVMWLVIQHAPLAMMERYLPVIAEAFAQKELEAVPLKMLLDRIHWLKYQTQLFGSQGPQIKLADEKTRQEVIRKYGLVP